MMKGGIAGLMKQAQQMQENMKKAQEQLAQVEVEGQSGAGMVKVVMTCAHDVRRVSIDALLALGDYRKAQEKTGGHSAAPAAAPAAGGHSN